MNVRLHPASSERPRRRRNEAGLMLVECIVYIACLSVVIGAATAVFFQVLDYTRALRRNADDITRVLHAGERWREDIRSATGRPVLETANGGWALHIPRAGGAVTWMFVSQAIARCDDTSGRCETLLPAVKEAVMTREARKQVGAWRWEIELPSRPRAVRVRPLFSFNAVAAGDLQP